jgi:hypothetical protein
MKCADDFMSLLMRFFGEVECQTGRQIINMTLPPQLYTYVLDYALRGVMVSSVIPIDDKDESYPKSLILNSYRHSITFYEGEK